jgi:MFS family permease
MPSIRYEGNEACSERGEGNGSDSIAGGFAASLHLLHSRHFGTYCIASFLSNLGTWAQQVAEPWLLLTLGASSFLIGLDSFAMAAPVWVLTLLGGVMADRGDRRRIITICQATQMLCPVALVALLALGLVEPWMVITLSVIVGITDAVSMPSFQTIVPSIVEHDQIASALALNATQFNLSRVIGPAFAGVLMTTIGAIGCFTLNATSYLPFIWVALWILPRESPPDDENDADERRLFKDIAATASNPQLRGALLTVLATSILCGPLIVFCPVLIKQVLHGDVGYFSASLGAFGLGGLLGAIVLLGIDPNRDRRGVTSWSAVAYGVVLVFASSSPLVWVLPAILALAGAAMTVSNTSANSLLQSTAPTRLRGEAISLYMLAMRGGLSIGSLLTGLSVSVLGAREALMLNGVLAVLVQIVLGEHWRRSISTCSHDQNCQCGESGANRNP